MSFKRQTTGMIDSDSEGEDDWTPGDLDIRPAAARAVSRAEVPSRLRRAAPPAATSSPTTSDSSTRHGKIRLNNPNRGPSNPAKPSRLRNVYTKDDYEDSEPTHADRRPSRNVKNPVVEKSESSEESSGSEEEDAEGSAEEDDEQEEEEDASGSEEDADVSMSEAATAPAPVKPPPARSHAPPLKPAPKAGGKIKLNAPTPARKASPTHQLQQSKIESVEAKEVKMGGTGESDDDLSSAASDEEDASGDSELDEEMANDEEDAIRAEDIDEDDLGSDESGTPDPAKQTRRQRRTSPNQLMALSNEAQKKKFFTQEEVSMRRAEMARRRKDLSDKRNEQEKLDTLDRLLHKRAPVRRSKKEIEEERQREEFGTPGGGDGSGEEEGRRAGKAYVRTIMGVEGTRVGVPTEWGGKVAGRVFEGARRQDGALRVIGGSRMVQVVE